MPLVTREGVELARVGKWNASTGPWNCTRDQIADAVRAGQSGKFGDAIIRRGHTDPLYAGDTHISGDGEPALGVVRNLRTDETGDSLIGDVTIQDWLDEELDAIYPSRSVEADLGVETADGDRYSMILTGLALLGATKPAIRSLTPLPERLAASEYTAAFSVAAGFFDEAAHPRGGKGTAAGGKFVAKGSGYKDQKDKQGHGAEADTVREVQAELLRLGLLSRDSGRNGGKDGLFGPKTEAAVKKWQIDHGNTPTGKVSPQLLATLKVAKKGDHGEAQKKADAERRAHPHKPGKTARKKPVAHRKAKRIMMAAEEVGDPLDLEVREITPDTVVFENSDGRVWLSHWGDDGDTVSVAEPIAGTVTYTPLATTVAARAAHAMSNGLLWARGWEVMHDQASPQGASSVDITPLREALGLDDTADEDAVLAAATERLQKPTETPATPIQESPAGDTPVVQQVETDRESTSQRVELSAVESLVAEKVAAALAPIQASTAAYEAKIGELSGELAQRKAAEAAATKDRILASALTDGKITPADRDQWSKDYDEAPAVTTRILASLKPGTAVPVMASGYAGTGDETSDDFAEFEKIWGAS